MKHILLALSLFIAGAAEAKVKVVATVSDLGAIAREVGGDQVDVDVLALSTQDPHYVDAKPSLIVKLSRADLLVLNGMELEVGWLPALLVGSRNAEVQVGGNGYLDCSTLITPKEVPMQKIDRSMGDIHPGGNPHYTKDPRNALPIAAGIAQKLSQLDPAHAAAYQANLKKFQADMQARISQWEKALAPFKGTPVVTYHKSWIYFAEWAGLDEVAFIEPKPGIQPNPTHVANVLGVLKRDKVPILLQETWYSSAVSDLLARNSSATNVRVPGMTPEGGRYGDYMQSVVDAVVKGLQAHRS